VPSNPREIEARYNGRCAVCHTGIAAGEWISYTPPHDGERSRSVHLACARREAIEHPRPLNDYQRSQVFEQSSPLPPRHVCPEDVRAADARERRNSTFEPFEDRNPLPQRLVEDEAYWGRPQDRADRRTAEADNAGAEMETLRLDGERRWREREQRRIEEARYQARREDVERVGRVPGRDPKCPCHACDDAGYQCDVCGNPGLENAPSNQMGSTAPSMGREKEQKPEAGASRQSSESLGVGFPRRPARARHIGEPRTRPNLKANSPEGRPDLPRNLAGRIQDFAWLDPSVCSACSDLAGPSHTGSSLCRSGSLASGGLRAHCSCASCWLER
jgi:hypothetical protein